MDIRLTTQSARDVACDALVVSVLRQSGERKGGALVLSEPLRQLDSALGGLITEASAAGEIKGLPGELTTIYTQGKIAARRLLLVGLGPQEKLDERGLRRAAASAVRHLQATGAHRVALAPGWRSGEQALLDMQAQVEGALLGAYCFEKYKSHHDGAEGGIDELHFLAEGSEAAGLNSALQHGHILAQATNFARDLINEPPNVLTPGELASRAEAMARETGLECEIFDRPRMQELGMGGLLAVSQGSAEPPKFIILRYRGAPDSAEAGIGLVGKGITFDTGGISIKPAASMDEMKGDMGGAAAVIGAMQAIARLKPAINVTALVPTTENMPGGGAYRPGDILKILNGKTIEIVNTDAEGRLILADALSYGAQIGLSPMIDVATLTGGVMVALGAVMAGIFTNDEALGEELVAAGRSVGEKYWIMPMDDEYREQIKSEVADIKQTGGRGASAITAAKILEHFVGEAKWAHLDIAGVSYSEKKPYQEKGGTGVAVRTLAEFELRSR